MQGQIIDQALTSIQKVLYGTGTNFLNVSTRSTDDELNELTDLISATKYYVTGTQTLVKEKDYRGPEKIDIADTVSNAYNVEYDIWNAYSIDEGRNYYYIHQEIMCSFANGYVDVYRKAVGTIAKVCEWYGKEIDITTTPHGDGALDMRIHQTSPSTTESSTSYTSGISGTIGGEIGFSGKKATGSVSGGVTISSSYTYTIDDVTISNLCSGSGSDGQLAWNYSLAAAFSKYAPFSWACTNLHEGALCGRTTFTAGTDYLISFQGSTVAPLLKSTNKVTLRSTCSKAGKNSAEREKTYTFENDPDTDTDTEPIKLPFLQASDFN